MSTSRQTGITTYQMQNAPRGATLHAPVEVMPQCITELAKQLERGKTLIGGLKWRKTLAARIAAAKPVNDQATYRGEKKL